MTTPTLKIIPALLLLAFFGCKTKQTILEPMTVGNPFEIPAWEYATNHFFIDTIYISSYNQIMQSPSIVLHPEYNIKWIQVWKQWSGLANSTALPAKAFITCPAVNSASYDSMRTLSSVFDIIDVGLFTPIDSSKYTYDPTAGTLTIFDSTITSDLSIAVSYERADGNQFGETPSMVPNDSTQTRQPMILKLIKPHYGQLPSSIAWKLIMKNFYQIGKTQVAQSGFSLDIFTNFQNSNQSDSVLGIPLLRVLGVDKLGINGSIGSDGVFDFLPGITIDKLHGEIIFPNVRPFDDGIREYFKSIGKSLPSNSQYTFPVLYDTTTYMAMYLANSYVIRGRTVN